MLLGTFRILFMCIGITTLGLLSGCMSSGEPSDGAATTNNAGFTEAHIILEYNATDDDAEVVIFVKGGDNGLVRLRIQDPSDSTVLDISTQETTVGIREITIETAEPGLASVIAAYPEGTYRVEGETTRGQRLRGTADLSHRLPSKPQLSVDRSAGNVTWTPIPEAAKYSIELEEVDGNKDVRKLTLDLPPSTNSFSIPKSFLSQGNYQVSVAVHGVNGNIIVVQQEFSIER